MTSVGEHTDFVAKNTCPPEPGGSISIKGPTVVESFAGIGSVSLAARELGFTILYANDKDHSCAEGNIEIHN